MTEEELEQSYLKVQETKKHFLNYMQESGMTPSEAVTTVTGLLMSMYDAMVDNPTVEDFIGTFGGIYKLHHALHNGGVQPPTQTLQ